MSEPHVSVEVEAYRPFFILGEVTTSGQYPYVANMTAETAIAIAGGFSPRADKSKMQLSRNMPGQQIKGDVPLSYPLRPGDTIVVKERWFYPSDVVPSEGGGPNLRCRPEGWIVRLRGR